MNVLVTGGTGFLGAEVVRQLLQQGSAPITVLDINPSPHRLTDVADQVQLRQGDLGNFSQVLTTVRKCQPQTIFHLGGMLSIPSERDPQAAFQANALGTWHVLEAARLLDVPQVIFSSSIGTYGQDLDDEPLTDHTLQRPLLFYGACKLFGEHMGLSYRRRYGIDFRGLRYPSLTGPGVQSAGALQFTSHMIEQAVRNQPVQVPVRPETCIPLLAVQDAARAAIELAATDATRIQTINYLLAGPQPTVQQLADAICRHLPDAQIKFTPNDAMQAQLDQAVHRIDDRCARDEWDWQPRYDTDAMVRDFIQQLQPGLDGNQP